MRSSMPSVRTVKARPDLAIRNAMAGKTRSRSTWAQAYPAMSSDSQRPARRRERFWNQAAAQRLYVGTRLRRGTDSVVRSVQMLVRRDSRLLPGFLGALCAFGALLLFVSVLFVLFCCLLVLVFWS